MVKHPQVVVTFPSFIHNKSQNTENWVCGAFYALVCSLSCPFSELILLFSPSFPSLAKHWCSRRAQLEAGEHFPQCLQGWLPLHLSEGTLPTQFKNRTPAALLTVLFLPAVWAASPFPFSQWELKLLNFRVSSENVHIRKGKGESI